MGIWGVWGELQMTHVMEETWSSWTQELIYMVGVD